MSEADGTERHSARPGRVRASLVAAACLLRRLPLFLGAAPKTPLRVLCIVALDTLHELRHARPLPQRRISELAAFLDFQACTNAAWDRKDLCKAEYGVIRQRLEKAGLELWIEAYLSQLRELETRRPPIGGDHRGFDEVRSYRAAVARLSLVTVAAIALHAKGPEDAIRATECDSDVDTLFRIAMLCQIIDDVVDYTEDQSAGLPSFLTACASLPQAMELTAGAARHYAASREVSSGNGALPLRMALCAVTAVTRLVVRVARRRHRTDAFVKGEDLRPPRARADADIEETC